MLSLTFDANHDMYSASIIPPLRPGTRAVTQSIFPFFLPIGLRSGAEVTVLEVEGDLCTIQDGEGKQWVIASVALDPGARIWEEGRWVLTRGAAKVPPVPGKHAA